MITDFPIGLGGLATLPVKEIVIPVGFSCPNGSLYRARALHYATCHGSAAQPNDWIVHLDEDTHFDRQCIRNILWHIEKEDMAVAGGQRSMPRIGQGIILYGAGEFENVITTLADSIRVANNFGRFAVNFVAFLRMRRSFEYTSLTDRFFDVIVFCCSRSLLCPHL